MEWIADPTGWLGLGTLILLEIVLGIDNLIFIAILVDRLPPAQRHLARIIGLSLALLMRVTMLAGLSWLQTLTTPLFTVLGAGLSVRDLILIAGGLFLLFKATTELHGRLEGAEARREQPRAVARGVLAGRRPDRHPGLRVLHRLRRHGCRHGRPVLDHGHRRPDRHPRDDAAQRSARELRELPPDDCHPGARLPADDRLQPVRGGMGL